MIHFVGGDPESGGSECPAVFVDSETGDFLVRGKTITDQSVITELNQHIGRAEDESDVWLPARLAPAVREALDGYERGKQGPGQHTFAELLEATQASVIRFEMRDSYDETDTTEKGFAAWKATGSTDAYEWGDHLDVVRAAVARGVRIRRVRIVSEPISEYIRWEYAITPFNLEAGEDIRWLPRTSAADLLVPGADCWVFDHRVIRWNFQRGDGTNPRHYTFSSDPRIIRDITAAFEIAWDRAHHTPSTSRNPRSLSWRGREVTAVAVLTIAAAGVLTPTASLGRTYADDPSAVSVASSVAPGRTRT